jgi:hypothetical protein
LKKAVQQGRSKRRGDAYSPLYVEPLSAARTKLEDFFNSLLALILRSVHVNARVHISRLGKAKFVSPSSNSEGLLA